MNKADGQLLYRLGWAAGQVYVMDFGRTMLKMDDDSMFRSLLKVFCEQKSRIYNTDGDNSVSEAKGVYDYCQSILRLIDNNVITGWPSFVEYMTGEAYEICQCYKCSRARGELLGTRMILCSKCGNKRCPHATNHENKCTNSNETGQEGSIYE